MDVDAAGGVRAEAVTSLPTRLALYGKPVLLGISIVVGLWLAVYIPTAMLGWTGHHLAWDFDSYVRGVDRFLASGTPYDPANVSGRHDRDGMGFVHPPISLILFVPLSLFPPLWWILPIGVVLWCMRSWRPSPYALALIVLLLAFPLSVESLLLGNSSLIVTGLLALGLRFGWPLALLAIKPTFVPLLVLGIRRRSIWIGVLVVLALCIPFWSLWLDWLAVLRNLEAEPFYNFYNLPLVIVPIVAWLGRTRSTGL